MTVGEVAQHVFPVLINTVEEEVLQLTLVRESTGLHVPQFLVLLLECVETCLEPQYLVFLELIVGPEEVDNFLVLLCWLLGLQEESLDEDFDARLDILVGL